MTKEIIANDINYKGYVARIIKTSEKLKLVEGTLYNNMDKAESWTDGDGEQFSTESNNGEYVYVLKCYKAEGHKVDYDNEEECEVLGCEDCFKESEVLIKAETKMEVISGENEADLEEMGYYVIELQVV